MIVAEQGAVPPSITYSSMTALPWDDEKRKPWRSRIPHYILSFEEWGCDIGKSDEALVDILLDKLAVKDAFGDRDHAVSYAKTLRTLRPPFVAAICGKWGSGKSTMLRYLVESLPPVVDGGVVLYFNAWRASLADDVMASFVSDMVKQLQDIGVVSNRFLMPWRAGKAMEALSDAAVEAFSDHSIATRFLAGTYQKARKQQLKQHKGARNAIAKLRDAYERVGEELASCGIAPFVLVDELDRCSPEDVVRVIEALRNLFCEKDELLTLMQARNGLNQKKRRIPFRFILTMDEEYVVRAFADQHRMSTHDANLYVSKFVQLRYHFPRRKWTTFTENLITKHKDSAYFPEGSASDFASLFTKLAVGSPREALRTLAYLVVWWQYHSDSPLLEDSLILKTLAKNGICDGLKRNLAVRLVNCYLLLFAWMKVVHPGIVIGILDIDFGPELSKCNGGSELQKILGPLFKHASCASERVHRQKTFLVDCPAGPGAPTGSDSGSGEAAEVEEQARGRPISEWSVDQTMQPAVFQMAEAVQRALAVPLSLLNQTETADSQPMDDEIITGIRKAIFESLKAVFDR